MRSITLMPVSSMSFVATISVNLGELWCIGHLSSDAIGPPPSIGCPVTFIILPSVPGPTGTEIGPPVSTASIPLDSPCVGSMAMHRTVLSPTCCIVSRVIVCSPDFTSTASKIDGMASPC